MSKIFLAVLVIAAAIAGALSLSARLPQGAAPAGLPPVQGAVDGVTAGTLRRPPTPSTRHAKRRHTRPASVAPIATRESWQTTGGSKSSRAGSGNSSDVCLACVDQHQLCAVRRRSVRSRVHRDGREPSEGRPVLGVLGQPWRQVNDDGLVHFLTGGLGTREVVAGAREYVMSFTYVAIDSPSTDPEETARQHAACAGAWLARADEAQSKNFEETAGQAREMAEREFAIAAPVLGREEAERIAASRARGPLLAECVPARMYVSG